MKRCSTLTIEEIQIKPAMIYNFTSIRRATVRETDLTSVGENVEKWHSPTHCCYRSKHAAALENRLAVLKKVIELSHTPLGMCPRKMKAWVPNVYCTLLGTAKRQNHTRCPANK